MCRGFITRTRDLQLRTEYFISTDFSDLIANSNCLHLDLDDIVNILMDYGADVNIRNKYGDTPLQVIVFAIRIILFKHKNIECTKLNALLFIAGCCSS